MSVEISTEDFEYLQKLFSENKVEADLKIYKSDDKDMNRIFESLVELLKKAGANIRYEVLPMDSIDINYRSRYPILQKDNVYYAGIMRGDLIEYILIMLLYDGYKNTDIRDLCLVEIVQEGCPFCKVMARELMKLSRYNKIIISEVHDSIELIEKHNIDAVPVLFGGRDFNNLELIIKGYSKRLFDFIRRFAERL